MVEFALTVAFLLPVFVGVFEFGYGFYVYNRLFAGVRAGARYASLRAYDSPNNTPSQAYLSAVRNFVVYGDPGGGTTPVVAGLSPDQVTVSVSLENSAPDMVTVSINNFAVDTVFKTLQWINKPSASFRYEGVYQP